ncbi:MAG: DUF1830 domain-containing protein [Cyanobium sp.]
MDRADLSPADLALEETLACGYRNGTDRMVILRGCGPQHFYLERVIFPFELLTFQCPPATELEVWTHSLGGPELLETLQIDELIIEPVPAPVLTGAAEAGAELFQHNPWLQAG